VSIVRTVLGDVPASDLGVCYAHEQHLIGRASRHLSRPISRSMMLAWRPLSYQTSMRPAEGPWSTQCPATADATLPVWRKFRALRASTSSLRRAFTSKNITLRATGARRLTVKQIAALFVAEIEVGADANDYGGPQIERLPNRCGVIKVASSLGGLTDRDRKILKRPQSRMWRREHRFDAHGARDGGARTGRVFCAPRG